MPKEKVEQLDQPNPQPNPQEPQSFCCDRECHCGNRECECDCPDRDLGD